uniref:splicing factor 3B subunit 2-like isoform X2 n=1 Tax=Fragaria vesca subsp. vesca TaxID=101020 RepID=UPI0005C87561|nr:PREDICTED: splicing factor 3B subunit 2-like isoform X2 [Fragaria vesca subsp. vesca]
MNAETILQQPKASHGDNDVEKLRKFFEKFMLEEGVGVEDLRILFEKLMVDNEGAGVDELRKGLEEFMLKEAAGKVQEKKRDDDESEEQAEENQLKQEKIIGPRPKRRCASRPNKLPVLNMRSNRKIIPVPKHWCEEEEYLQGESRIEKPPYQLPCYIAATGIEEIRQNQREEDRNKLGAVCGNYQVLYDAFFKYQTKPKLTALGDLYYEGKEFDQIQVSLRDQNHQMKNCWVRGAVELTKHYRDLEKEEERLYHDMVAELEKKKKRKMKKD